MNSKIYISNYIYIVAYFIIALLIDHIGVFSIERRFYIKDISIFIVFIIFISTIIFLLNKLFGKILAIILLLFQAFLNVIFKLVYIMQGQTVFSFSQLKFIGEGREVITKLKLDYLLILNYIMLIVLYIIFAYIIKFKNNKPKKITYPNFLIRLLSIILISVATFSSLSSLAINTYFDYDNKAYSPPKTYNSYSVTANALTELFNYKNTPPIIDENEVLNFLFEEIKTNKGISKNNNLIVILAETFEWYSFIQDENLYPNGLTNLTKTEIKYLLPNLTWFYDNSLKMTNYYSKETTLYSENLVLLGHHPYKTIPTYDHTFSDYSYSLPNMFKNENYQTNYFHNNNIYFYGRETIMPLFGFDNVYGQERLLKEFENELDYSKLKLKDSYITKITDFSMFDVAKEIMFPLDKKFFTFITTLTMHGSYESVRDSLKAEYERIDSLDYDIFPRTKEGRYFKNYFASVINFDSAIGTMINYLAENNLLENITIILLSDHHAYSNNLTYYVRDKTFYDPIVFNVPFMIYDKNLSNGIIDKFTTNIDVLPTIFDILGIDHYSNFYYGYSIFDDRQSISYSYYYDSFQTDKILFKSMDNIIYIDDNLNNNYLLSVEQNINALFEKIKYIDQWYYYYSKKKV